MYSLHTIRDHDDYPLNLESFVAFGVGPTSLKEAAGFCA